MLKILSHILLKILFTLLCFFLLIFPTMNFKIGIESVIFPALEIILIYYFSSLYKIGAWIIFIFGIFCDQLYSFPLGTNSLIFLIIYRFLESFSQSIAAYNYLANFIGFCCYCFLVLNFRCLLVAFKDINLDIYIMMVFQYLNTIFSYSLIRLLLDNPLKYFRKNA